MSERLPEVLPRHVAIIMDGNGRWARERGLPRVEGHEAGFESARVVTECCRDWGIEVVTLYAFSTENWKRPREEVRFLMSRLRKFLREHRKESAENNVRLRAIGDVEGLPKRVQNELKKTVDLTRDHTGMTVVLALNYGGRQEIVQAARALARKVREGEMEPEDVEMQVFGDHLYTAGLPEPDLMIRTGGEMRLSNFLLWQLQYSELYMTETYWPDFRKEELLKALRDYARRERRYGGLSREKARSSRKGARPKRKA